jgi:hypothetical protein
MLPSKLIARSFRAGPIAAAGLRDHGRELLEFVVAEQALGVPRFQESLIVVEPFLVSHAQGRDDGIEQSAIVAVNVRRLMTTWHEQQRGRGSHRPNWAAIVNSH